MFNLSMYSGLSLWVCQFTFSFDNVACSIKVTKSFLWSFALGSGCKIDRILKTGYMLNNCCVTLDLIHYEM